MSGRYREISGAYGRITSRDLVRFWPENEEKTGDCPDASETCSSEILVRSRVRVFAPTLHGRGDRILTLRLSFSAWMNWKMTCGSVAPSSEEGRGLLAKTTWLAVDGSSGKDSLRAPRATATRRRSSGST
jgi:hypothetical protein